MDVTIRGDLLKSAILKQYGSIIKFAGAVGVSRAYIYQVIAGDTLPSLERVAQFAQLLGMAIDDLVVLELEHA